ncbi:DnaA N-terminal domain-containing protein [uncultured Ferrovibrio sp.]|jgi:hypothetical protein|uniref:DnaA N-terminal domain-containing protein n=1 Tax=uncultured Ferrovibrio sp. TaxID=1576913 RepID=UPI002635E2A9|nr:DnaA N-terminal domain-containing protein [uncultured Ferrovibrio sp.]
MEWFRWHHGTVTDPKWRVVAKRAGVTLRDVIAVWAAMLECASQAENRGYLVGWNAEDVAAGLDMEPEQVKAIYDAMQGKTLEGDRLTNWEKRQPKREDNTAAERKRRQREREKEAVDRTDVTHGHGTSRDVTTDKNRGDENREESTSLRDGAPPALVLVGDDQQQDRGKDKTKRGTRLTADMELPERWALWAKAEGHPDPQAEWERFRDYWCGVAGKDGVKLDWEGTWRNRVRKVLQEGRPAVGHKQTGATSTPVEFDPSLEPWLPKLAREFDPSALRSWFTRVRAIESDDRITLVAPSKFIADYIRQQFSSQLRQVFGDQFRVTHQQPTGKAA